MYEGEINVFLNKPGHMTNMANMSVYGKNTSKIFSGFAEPIATRLHMLQLRLEYYIYKS